MESKQIRELNLEELEKVSGGTDHSGDLCPSCSVHLESGTDWNSYFWKCPLCGNRYFVTFKPTGGGSGGERRRY